MTDYDFEKLNELAKRVNQILIQNGMSLSVAESFTGGTISSAIVSVPGASKFFLEGIVCYSNEAKINRLGVNIETIERFGAISTQTAEEMILGLKRTSLAPTCAIATTGNADVSLEKTSSDGEAFVAVAVKDKMVVNKLIFSRSRQENIVLGAIVALETLIDLVKN